MSDRTEPTPTAELITTAFDSLPLEQKMAAFEDIACSLSSELGEFGDPVLSRELDVLDAIQNNIANRVEEIKAIYGSN